MNNQYLKLHALSFGLALGILWGITIFLTGLIAMYGYGVSFVNIVSEFYIGYGPSIVGSLIGLVFGFLDGLIGGLILAWLYNYLVKKTCKNI